MAKNKKNCKHPLYSRSHDANGWYCAECMTTGLEAPPAPVIVPAGIYKLEEAIDNSVEKDGRSTDWTRGATIEPGTYYVYPHGDGMRIEKAGHRTYDRMLSGHSNQALMLSKLVRIEGTDSQFINLMERQFSSSDFILEALLRTGKITRVELEEAARNS